MIAVLDGLHHLRDPEISQNYRSAHIMWFRREYVLQQKGINYMGEMMEEGMKNLRLTRDSPSYIFISFNLKD